MADERSEPTVTEDDVGMPVVDTAEGHQIGTIAGVDGESVLVDPDPDMADDARASLGWDDPEETYSLPMDALARESEGDTEAFRLDLASVNR